MRLGLDPDRRSLIVATPDLGIPDPDVLAFLAQFAGEHPDMQFEPLAAIPGLTNSMFLDGEAVTVDLGDDAAGRPVAARRGGRCHPLPHR